MKKLKSSVLAGLAAILTLFPAWKNSSLKEIAKPYLGVYECESATWGQRDYLEEFSLLRLELQPKNEFVLSYELKNGKKGKEQGKYEVDEKRKVLILTLGGNEEFTREFPLQKGSIVFSLPIASQMLVMKFTQK